MSKVKGDDRHFVKNPGAPEPPPAGTSDQSKTPASVAPANPDNSTKLQPAWLNKAKPPRGWDCT